MNITVFLISLAAFAAVVWLTGKLINRLTAWADNSIAETFKDRP